MKLLDLTVIISKIKERTRENKKIQFTELKKQQNDITSFCCSIFKSSFVLLTSSTSPSLKNLPKPGIRQAINASHLLSILPSNAGQHLRIPDKDL